jgi:CRP-like cAMP-binding protein
MSLASDIEILGRVPFFAGFSEEHLKLIAFSAEHRSFPADMALFEEGQPLHSGYVILSGRLEGTRKNGGARAIGPGEMLLSPARL